MASDTRIVAFLVDQVAAAGTVSAKAMFGEYGLYCDGRLVATICDDQLYVKPTAGGRALAVGMAEASPYPGAKPCLRIDPERWDDGEWMVRLIAATAAELPPPRPRKAKPGKVTPPR